jgi:predicted GTPase
MEQSEEFFERLEQESGIKISKEQREAIRARLAAIVSYNPKVGLFGKTGAGKSSLCNALFGSPICKVSDIDACTRTPQEVLLPLGEKGIKLLDFPGVGESVARDIEYERLYTSYLSELDCVLWVLKADDRAYETDIRFYEKVVKPHIHEQQFPLFFVVNQVDRIEPFRDWNTDKHHPSSNQRVNIEAKIDTIAHTFNYPRFQIIPVSAKEKWNLGNLIDTIASSLPKEKRIGFAGGVTEDARSPVVFDGWVKATWEDVVGDVVYKVTGNKRLAKLVRAGAKFLEATIELVEAIGDAIKNSPPVTMFRKIFSKK